MSSTIVPPAPRPFRARSGVATVAATVLAFGVAVGLAVPTLRVPGHVDEVTVENPHPWSVEVGGDGGRYPVGAVDRESRQSFVELPDQGDEWSFTFAYAGRRAEVRLTADELRRQGWTVTVPEALADDLRAEGVDETPR